MCCRSNSIFFRFWYEFSIVDSCCAKFLAAWSKSCNWKWWSGHNAIDWWTVCCSNSPHSNGTLWQFVVPQMLHYWHYPKRDRPNDVSIHWRDFSHCCWRLKPLLHCRNQKYLYIERLLDAKLIRRRGCFTAALKYLRFGSLTSSIDRLSFVRTVYLFYKYYKSISIPDSLWRSTKLSHFFTVNVSVGQRSQRGTSFCCIRAAAYPGSICRHYTVNGAVGISSEWK